MSARDAGEFAVLAQPHRAREGEGVAHAGLLLVRRANPDVVAELPRDAFQHLEALGADAVVIGEENSQSANLSSRSC